MPYLMLVSIGPVQEFIASARRSRDLWFGSWLLSELSRAAAVSILEHTKPAQLIFPAVDSLMDLNNGELNVANKLIAVIEQSPKEVGKAIEDAVCAKLMKIKDGAYSKLDHALFDVATATTQVADLLEFFWVALPLGDYRATRMQLESLLAARKATREFNPVTWGKAVPKSSLDGQRESVIPESAFESLSEQVLRRRYGIRKGERLCGVGLLKRHGNRGAGDRFFSTSHVAALPLIQRLTNPQAIGTYINELRGLDVAEADLGNVPRPSGQWGHYDGHLLFEERLPEFFEAQDRAGLAQARRSLKHFLDAVADGKRPEPYYALLLADGDRMGATIDHQPTLEAHRALSQHLVAFASQVRMIVETRHQGSLVYAGGDDVLAFVPLHTVLSCANELAQQFYQQLSGYTDENGHTPTLSVGVAVSHHLEPLSDALELARSAEKRAKRDRNSLSVVVSKRGGGDRTVSGVWGTMDKRVDTLIDLHRLDAVPDSAAYELRDLAQRLNQAVLQPMLRAETVRILKRKRPVHGQVAITDETLETLGEMIDAQRVTISQLADELIVARVFADAADLANLPPPSTRGA
ncbi:MAG: type III-B CRISPR-associated protein Cas10/Cmr2 [Herpetosiphonaceae bacterium]|nr:type III-B CRISPR-associated protein Cas10/Cmr2 [Herpetosiphonaceae bacterium]